MHLIASRMRNAAPPLHTAALCMAALLFLSPSAGRGQAPSPDAPTGPVPRTPDGKPDLSGTWIGERQRHLDGLELTRWGEAQYLWNTEPIIHQGYHEPIERQRIELDPVFHCYPSGMVRLSLTVPDEALAEGCRRIAALARRLVAG